MKAYLLLGLMLFSQLSFAQTNDSIRIFIDRSFDLIKEHSISVRNIDSIKSWLCTESEKLASLDEVAPLYEHVFRGLDDSHGNLTYKGKTYGWRVPLNRENAYIKTRLKNEKSVVSAELQDRFGYIRIPGNNDLPLRKSTVLLLILSHTSIRSILKISKVGSLT